jgi:hypothetical protein
MWRDYIGLRDWPVETEEIHGTATYVLVQAVSGRSSVRRDSLRAALCCIAPLHVCLPQDTVLRIAL